MHWPEAFMVTVTLFVHAVVVLKAMAEIQAEIARQGKVLDRILFALERI